MSGPKMGLAALVLAGVMVGNAHAQGVVPGGWSSDFGYQTFEGPSEQPSAPFGYRRSIAGLPTVGSGGMIPLNMGMPTVGMAGMSYYAGDYSAAYPNDFYAGNAGMPLTVNATGGLINVIQRSVPGARR